MGNWTNGPWTKSKVNPKVVNGNDDYYEIIWSQDGELISDGVYGKTNAQLISAAPDMAEALDDIIMAFELPGNHCEMEQAIERAKKALSKAKCE